MRGSIVFLALAVCVFSMLISPSAFAQTDMYTGDKLLPSNYLAPRLACGRVYTQECVLVAYNNNTKRVEIFITESRFAYEGYPLTPSQTLPADPNIGTLLAIDPSASVPYDVVYLQDDDVVYGAGAFNWDLGGGAWQNDFGFIIPYDRYMYGIDVNDGEFGFVNTTNNMGGGLWRWFKDNSNALTPIFMAVEPITGRIIRYHRSTVHPNINYSLKNWASVDYIGGLIMDTDWASNQFNKSYILIGWNSSSGMTVFSNTTDDMIGVGNYTGFFELEGRLSNYRYYAKNSTDVIQYDDGTDDIISFWEMGGNNIIAQSVWIDPYDANDKAFAFQNSSGIYLWNSYTSLFVGYPDEYNVSKTILVRGGIPFVQSPHMPRVACSNDMSQCAMLVFDSSVIPFVGGLHLYHTIDPHHVTWTSKHLFPDSFTADISTFPDFQPQYDIAYNEDTGIWRIIIRTKLYEWDGSALPVLVKTYGSPTPYSQDRAMSFADTNGEYVYATLNHYCGTYCYEARLAVTTWKGGWNEIVANVVTFPVDNNGVSVSNARGFVTGWGTGAGYKYEIRYTWRDYDFVITEHWYARASTPLSNMDMTDEHAYTVPPQYYYPDEGIAFFERDAGDIPNDLGHGMYYAGNIPVSGNDWVYPTVSAYYIYDVPSGEETFTHSKKSPTTGTKYYAVSTKKGLLYDAVRFYEKAYYTTTIISDYYDVALIDWLDASITVTLICTDGSGYTTTASGSTFILTHPCTQYNITAETTAYRPYYKTFNTQFEAGCDYNLIWFRYLKAFGFPMIVIDDVLQVPIENALVDFGGSAKYTDSNGRAEFTIFPLVNESMTNQTAPTCQERWVTSASAVRAYTYDVSKSGFEPEDGLINPAYFEDSTLRYLSDYQVNLRPVGGKLTIRLRDRNGREIVNPDLSSTTEVIGFPTVYIMDINTAEIKYIGNREDGIPVQFYVVFNESQVNATVNFTYACYGTQTKNVTLIRESNVLEYFSINETILDMCCDYNLDCESNFCEGNYWYRLEGCLNAECSYKTPEYCTVGCDPELGCYDRKLVDTCDTRYDCNSTCLSDWKSAMGMCGDDEYCVQVDTVCETPCPPPQENRGCNNATGLCCEAEQCYESGREKYRFLLAYYYVDTEHLVPASPNPYVSVVDYDWWCGVQNKGERICIDGATIPHEIVGAWRTSETFVTTTPDNWAFEFDENNDYDFYDIAVECGVACQSNWEYCEHGCDRETTYCFHAPTEEANFTEQYDINIYQPISIVEDSINQSQLRESGLAFLLLLATPIFIITIIALLIGTAVGWKTKEPLLGAIGFISILSVFSLLQLFPIWLVLILIVITGMVFSKMIVGLFKGGV